MSAETLFVLIQYQSVTDRRTDGHLLYDYIGACIGCYTTALVMSLLGCS